MAEYVLISDVHASDRAPSSCTDAYFADILDLLGQTAELARDRRAAAIVIAGDLFHCKAPSRTSHSLIMQLMSVLNGPPREDFVLSPDVYVVPGNHDLLHDRQESLIESQPLGVLLQAGAVRMLDGWADHHMLYGVPWQQKWDNLHVFDALQSYRDWRVHSPTQPALVVAHAPLYPPGKELPYEFYPAAQWADAMGGGGQCFYGHVHEPHGVWSIDTSQPGIKVPDAIGTCTVGSFQDQVTFCNNGALSRGSLHEYNLDRQVGATIWDSDTCRFTFVPLRARPASEVFRLQEHAQAITDSTRLDEFLAAITVTSLGVVSIESVLEHFKSLDGIGAMEMGLIEELLAEAQRG